MAGVERATSKVMRKRGIRMAAPFEVCPATLEEVQIPCHDEEGKSATKTGK
jgi:hypothetical protein